MQWGRTLHQMTWYIYTSDQRQGMVLLYKTDLSDRLYTIPLTPTGALKLSFPFPNLTGDPKLAATPTKILVVWTEYPPALSSSTDTIYDMIYVDLNSYNEMPQPNPLETLASTPAALESSKLYSYPTKDTVTISNTLNNLDVDVYDFVKACQLWFNALRVQRCTFHNTDAVF